MLVELEANKYSGKTRRVLPLSDGTYALLHTFYPVAFVSGDTTLRELCEMVPEELAASLVTDYIRRAQERRHEETLSDTILKGDFEL